jgi:hypothetical protein
MQIVTWRQTFLNNLSTIFLMLSAFFFPFGFDILFKLILDATQSYWTTDLIFYGFSLFFFLLYLWVKKVSKK